MHLELNATGHVLAAQQMPAKSILENGATRLPLHHIQSFAKGLSLGKHSNSSFLLRMVWIGVSGRSRVQAFASSPSAPQAPLRTVSLSHAQKINSSAVGPLYLDSLPTSAETRHSHLVPFWDICRPQFASGSKW